MGKQILQITQTKPLHSLLILGSAILTLVVAILVVAIGTSTDGKIDYLDGGGSIGFYNVNAQLHVSVNATGWVTLVLAAVAIIPLVVYSVLSKKINEIQVGSVLLALVSVIIIVALVNDDIGKAIYELDDEIKLNGAGWTVFVIAIAGIVASAGAIGLSSYSLVKNYKKGPASSKKASAK